MKADKYFIYTRKSQEQDERQALSIEAQLRELRDLVAKEGLEIAASFEEAKTAREPGRRIFAEMLARIEAGEAKGIVTWHPDRLARNSIDGGKIIYLLDTEMLTDLKFATMGFENTAQGKFMLTLAFGQGKYYSDSLSENVKRGIRQKLRRGEWPGCAPIGYINDLRTKTIEIDPDRAPLVRKAFEQYATGEHTLQSLRSALKKIGLRSFKGNTLSVSSLQRLLRNPVYYGFIERKEELYEGSHKPLITKRLFDDARDVMHGRSKPKLRRRKHDFLFTGLMSCPMCGCAVTAEIQKGHTYYHCSKRKGPCPEKYFREESLLEQVKKIVEEVALPDEHVEKMLAKVDEEETESMKDHRAALRALTDDKAQIESKLDKLLDLHLDGSLERSEYLKKKNDLLSRKADLEQEIRTREERRGASWFEHLRIFIRDAGDAKKYLSPEHEDELPTLLRKLGSNVSLTGQTVRLRAAFGWCQLRETARCSDWLPIVEHLRTDWMQDILELGREITSMKGFLSIENPALISLNPA